MLARLLLLAMAALIALPLPAAAQDIDLDAYPEVDLDGLDERYRDWIEREVRWIITPDERDVFGRLDSDAKRDEFIEQFWANRDPSPGTERNEYREMHYERLEHATRNFGRDTPRPGWMTDMGRIWILLGEPQTLTRLPNTNRAVPSEVWFYAVDPALRLPPFFYLIFFKDAGVGEYRLWSPAMDGPAKLLDPSGQAQLQRGTGGLGEMGAGSRMMAMDENSRAVQLLQQADQELAQAAGSLIPGESIGMNVSPLRSEMVISRVLDLPNVLMPQATWAYAVLTGITESRVRFETLPMDATAVALIDPSGDPFVHFMMRTVGDALNLNNYEDRYYLTFDVSSSIRDTELRVLEARDPRTLQADIDEEMARRLRGGPVQYMERVPVVPGDYTLDLVMENNVTREFARTEIPLRVPGPDPERLGGSEPLLVYRARDLGDEYSPFGEQFPFQIGSVVLIPAIDGPVPNDGAAAIYRQIYVPSGASEPMLERVALTDAAGAPIVEKLVRIDPWDRNDYGVIDQLVQIDLRGVAPGTYTMEVGLEQALEPHRLPVRVIDAADFERPFVHSLPYPPAGDPGVRLERARQLRTLGRTGEAIEVLASVLRRAPELREALELQVELLRDAGRYDEIDRVLAPRLAESPNDVGLLLEVAEVKAMQGEHFDAIRYYERARIGGAEETPELLNALASEYWAEGRAADAAALLRRSLELQPEQPQMQRLLIELEAALRSEGGEEP
jgi:GWxTD domain-containing protein